MIDSRRWAEYSSVVKARRLFSVANPGPLGITWPSISPAAGGGVPISSVSLTLVSEYQSVAKRRLRALTAGPCTRATSSTHSRPALWFAGLLYPGSIRFCEPVNATVPSTIRILRWLRRSGRRHSPLSGWIGQHRMPLDPGPVQPCLELLVPGDAA